MTAEIAILNRQGIALAADSAIAIGRKRVWKTGNKLFSLGPQNDIAAMIYGSGEFIGFPWEIIIKQFRETITTQFKTVKECSDGFFQFLDSSTTFRNDEEERVSIALLFVEILEAIEEEVESKSAKDFAAAVKKEVAKAIEYIEQDEEEYGLVMTEQVFAKKYARTMIKPLAKDIYKRAISNEVLSELTKLCFEFTRRKYGSDWETGVVFAGFGSNEVFPSVYHSVVDGRDENMFRHWLRSVNDTNDPNSPPPMVLSFGQTDIFYLFMEGISQNYLTFFGAALDVLLRDKSQRLVDSYVTDSNERTVESRLQEKDNAKVLEGLFGAFEQYRRNEIVDQILSVVAGLPKEEMASMAEALVELTSLRRRIDSPLETVGGPIDVAIISKGDGLVWVKRKHYFDLAMNTDFKYRKQLRHKGTGS